MDKNTRILITGATGFIGIYLVLELLAKGYKNITATARQKSKKDFLKKNNINIVFADVTDKGSLSGIKGEYDVVFHCAGFVSDGNEKVLEDVNVRGTENICQWALERRIKKFIYVSSVAVNSGNTQIPLTEDMPYKATNRYGFSKLEAERIALRFRDVGLPMVILRPCMVYGQGEPHMMEFLVRLIKLRLLFLPNRGKTKLHLVSVRNVAACLLCCMKDGRALGKTFNIADNEVYTVSEIFKIFSKSIGCPNPILLPYSITKIIGLIPVIGKRIKFLCKDRVYSIERLRNELNFTPPYQADLELSWSVKTSPL
ncbi:MAG: NAD-dependent epimerase/dehydratase family protein [Candidatus Omnitrophica bacterium]|nr:NAD-dependent epimerase/dehydratase family protein [Candidatus Omnitrophota bacterium]